MKHLTVLIMKFISCIIAFAIGLDLFFDATMVDILSFSLLVTTAGYLIGDRIILPHLGKRAATTVDFIFTYMSVWIFGSILLDSYLQIAWGSVLSATLITVAEVYVHRYLADHAPSTQTNENQQSVLNRKLAYGTEFAEEPDIRDKD